MRNEEGCSDADPVARFDADRARNVGVLVPQDLSQLRNHLGLTPRQVAAHLQIGEETWTRWERGHEIPTCSLNLLLLALGHHRHRLSPVEADQPAAHARALGANLFARPNARTP